MPAQMSYYIVAFISGAAVMSYEILGSRILAPDFGNSIFVWGSLIGIFMAGLSCGYFIGGVLSDIKKIHNVLMIFLLVSGGLIGSFPLYGFHISQALSSFHLGPRLGPFIASLALFFMPAVLLGGVTPLCTSMLIRQTQQVGRGVGSLYAVSTIGSILGTIGTAFFIILWIGVKVSLLMLGIILMATSILFFLNNKRGRL